MPHGLRVLLHEVRGQGGEEAGFPAKRPRAGPPAAAEGRGERRLQIFKYVYLYCHFDFAEGQTIKISSNDCCDQGDSAFSEFCWN